MEEESREMIVLGAIKNGNKKFGKILRATKTAPEELESILDRLKERGFVRVEEKKGWLGKKVEITTTEKGDREVDERVHELQEKWGQMSALYKSGDKGKLKQYMDDNRSFLPMMMFFGIMDIMMFSMMFSMMGSMMTDYVPAQDMPAGMEGAADGGADGGAGDGMDSGMGDGGGFDIDIGF